MFDLHESDLPELERLAAEGCEWIAKDADGSVSAFSSKPIRYGELWVYDLTKPLKFSIAVSGSVCNPVRWSDPEPLNIADAIAQIKAMKKQTIKPQSAEEILNEFCEEQDKKPLTWNDRINQMTAEEKASELREYIDCASCPINTSGGCRCNDYCTDAECVKKLTGFFNSPCTEAADD